MSTLDRQPDQTRWYTLDFDLRPVECTKAEWLAWAALDVSTMAYTHIESEGVHTEFPGFAAPHQRLFRTRVFGLVAAGMHDGTDTYEEAMAVHERLGATVRAMVVGRRRARY